MLISPAAAAVKLPFTPHRLSPSLWLDAVLPRTLTLRNSAGTDFVTDWSDRSGNDHTAAQATEGSQPQHQTGQINGLPAVYFDGGDNLTIPAAASIDNLYAGGGYGAMILKAESGLSGSDAVVTKGDNLIGSVGWQLLVAAVSGSTYRLGFQIRFSGSLAAWNMADLNMTIGTPHLFEWSYNADDTANNPSMWVDGVAQSVSESTAPSGTVEDDSSADMNIALRPGSSLRYQGRMGDITLFSATPTSAAQEQNKRFLGNKYGIGVS